MKSCWNHKQVTTLVIDAKDGKLGQSLKKLYPPALYAPLILKNLQVCSVNLWFQH